MTRRVRPVVPLEELFDSGEPVPYEPRERRPLVQAGLLALGSSHAIYAVLYIANFVLPYPLILATCIGAALAREAVRLVIEPSWLRTADLVAPVRVRRRLEPGDWYEGGDGMAKAVRSWERALNWGEVDRERF